MSATPPITDTTLFLYSAVASTKFTIDFQAVGAALGHKAGTVSMRYRRLKDRLDKHGNAAAVSSTGRTVDDNTLFLYQCMIVSGCKPDWKVVGVATGLKPATASMRWRRLQERIEKNYGTAALMQAQANPTPAPTPTKASNTRKRKSNPAKEESESDGETESKKIKTEEEVVDSEKRQTRGKVLNLPGMFDSSSSATGTTTEGPSTSIFEGIAAQDADDADDEDSVTEGSRYKTRATPKTTPIKKERAYKPQTLLTPQSGSHSSTNNPKPSLSSATSISLFDGPLTPVTSASTHLMQSIEADEDDGAAALNRLQNGRMIRMNMHDRRSASSSTSNEIYETAPESVGVSGAYGIRHRRYDPSEAEYIHGEDAMSSVAPEDSISMIGARYGGGFKPKRAARAKDDTFFGKLWGLFG